MANAARREARFDAMFSESDDPWKFRERWYEERKRALTLALLPHRRYGSAFEPGCANGELSASLATRCDRLLASDGSAAAVEAAKRRAAGTENIELMQAWMPDDWPGRHFDLIVVSELAYYLDAAALDALVDRIRASLNPGGVLLACHWRRPIEGCSFTGDEVHARLADRMSWPRLSSLVEADFRLETWCEDGRSVGERESLT